MRATIAPSGIMRRIEGALAFLRQQAIVIPDPADVRRYLLSHSDLLGLVVRIGVAAHTALGTQAQLSLEVYHDPEIEADHLTFYARQGDYEPGFLRKLEDVAAPFDQEFVEASAYVILTTDFRPPR